MLIMSKGKEEGGGREGEGEKVRGQAARQADTWSDQRILGDC